MKENKELNTKRIEVRLPEDLYRRIKLELGYETSKLMRKHFEKILAEKDKKLDKFKKCWIEDCKEKISSFDDLELFSIGNPEEKSLLLLTICKKHVAWLNNYKIDKEKLKKKDVQETDINCIKETISVCRKWEVEDMGEHITELADFCNLFPDKWKLVRDGLVEWKNTTKEEFVAQCQTRNEMRGL